MLLDTSGLFCIVDGDDPFNGRAKALTDAAAHRCTHGGILEEFVALGQARGLPRRVVLSFVKMLLHDPDLDIVWCDERLLREGLNLLNARLDKTYSLCDAISFVIMRQHHLTDALTTDKHFEQEGFRRLLVST